MERLSRRGEQLSGRRLPCCRLRHIAGRGVGVVDLGPIYLLKALHGADGSYQLERRVIVEQVAIKIESQRRHAVGRQEKAHLQPLPFKVAVG